MSETDDGYIIAHFFRFVPWWQHKNAKKATKEYYELKKMLGITPKLETLIKLEAE